MLYSNYNNKFQVSKIKLWFNIRPHSWRSRVLCTCRFTIHHVDIPDRFYQRTIETDAISMRKNQRQARTRTTDYISLYSELLPPRLHILKAPQSSQVEHTLPWGPAKWRTEILWELETLCISPERRDTTSLAMCVDDFQITCEFLLSNSDYEPSDRSVKDHYGLLDVVCLGITALR